MEYNEVPKAIETLKRKLNINHRALNLLEVRNEDVMSVEVLNNDAFLDRIQLMDLLRSSIESMNCELNELVGIHDTMTKVASGLLK